MRPTGERRIWMPDFVYLLRTESLWSSGGDDSFGHVGVFRSVERAIEHVERKLEPYRMFEEWEHAGSDDDLWCNEGSDARYVIERVALL
jgi:hypothetical protein